MFEVVGQDIISGNMGFIGTDSDRLYRMGAAEKTEDITVTGNPAVLDNATGKPFADLHIYGKSEQMTTTGAQLLDASKLKENRCTMKIEEQGRKITITGRGAYTGARIETADIGMFSDGIGKQIFISEKATVLSGNANVMVALSYVLDGARSYIARKGTGFVTGIIPDGATIEAIQINVNHSNEALDEDTTVVFEDLIVGIGSAALPFEPYTGGKPSPSPDYPQEIVSAGDDGNLSVIVKNPDNEQMQSVSFSTPNGLPGIPVSANGNYTDSNGQQWACDELDFERGVYRQWIKHVNVVFHKTASPSTHSGYRHIAVDIKNLSNHKECLCNIATYSKDAANGTEGVRASGGYNAIILYYENLTNDNVPADVAYILSDPIETPLTAAEIAAYKSLRTYRGTTIVEAEDKAGISVTYKRNAKAAEKEVNILHADLMAEMEELDENSEIV